MEAILLTILVATLPVVGLLYYFWHKDKGEKEPMRLMRDSFIWGILVIFPVIIAEMILMAAPYYLWEDPPLLYWVLMPFLCVALPEEFAKLLVVKKVAYENGKFNEIMDGITYCIIASMGFAVFENIMYTFQFGVGIGILRAFTAVPAHALFSGIMGYYIGVAKFTKDPAVVKKLFQKGLLWGVVLHGLYDFLLMSGIPELILLVFPLLIYMWFQLHALIKRAHVLATKKA
ncbi:MAG: PrsW family glutamic-type intramembrane protease [Patescibacteria group bacterium]